MTVINNPERSFRVPTIDITPFRTDPTSIEALKVVAQVREACITSGFFALVGHGIPRSLQDKLFKAAEALFALTPEEKKSMDRTKTGGPHNRGYELMGTQFLQKGAGADQKEVKFSPTISTIICNLLTISGLLRLTTFSSRAS
jgi:isopenicillin N synthase-like dioxygenase